MVYVLHHGNVFEGGRVCGVFTTPELGRTYLKEIVRLENESIQSSNELYSTIFPDLPLYVPDGDNAFRAGPDFWILTPWRLDEKPGILEVNGGT